MPSHPKIPAQLVLRLWAAPFALNQKQLSALLGEHQPSVSRWLRVLERDGLATLTSAPGPNSRPVHFWGLTAAGVRRARWLVAEWIPTIPAPWGCPPELRDAGPWGWGMHTDESVQNTGQSRVA